MSVLLNQSQGSFFARSDFYCAELPLSVWSADFDNDGDFDLVTADWGAYGGSGILATLINDGSGAFGPPTFVGYGGPIDVCSADLNGDGLVDLSAAGNGPDAANINFNYGGGTFIEMTDARYGVCGYPNAICNADFDGDGGMDLATANIAGGGISVLLNKCCIGLRGDVNGDGDDANIIDLTFLVDFVFRGSGDPGPCPKESDVNRDGDSANILDLTYLVDSIFRGGPLPPACP